MKKFALFLTIIFVNIATYAQTLPSDVDDISSQDKYFLSMKTAPLAGDSKPFVWNDYFILVYSAKNVYRHVGVAFEHEHYSVIHSFTKNDKGAYVYSARLPKVDKIKYRLVVDSTWQEDPNNSNYELDRVGIKVSVLNIQDRNSVFVGGPKVKDKIVDFYLKSKPDSLVFLNGSFSKWDPFLFRMNEVEPGIYHIAMPLDNGEHYYTFFVNGKRQLDPANLDIKKMGSTGESVNKIVVNRLY